MDKRQALKAISDLNAGARWIKCHPVKRCARCGCEGLEPLAHAVPPVDVCVNCGSWDSETYEPEVLGAP